jgi:hypothetical protein
MKTFLVAFFVTVLPFSKNALGFLPGTKSSTAIEKWHVFKMPRINMNADLVEAKLVVSGKNVQGPWYRTIIRNEVKPLLVVQAEYANLR